MNISVIKNKIHKVNKQNPKQNPKQIQKCIII